MRTLVTLVVGVLFCSSGLAELAPPMTYLEGRLFTTPQQRQNLDRLRQQEQQEQQAPFDGEPALAAILATFDDEPSTLLPAEVIYSGYVVGPGRVPTVWIDGNSELTQKSALGFQYYVGTASGREARFQSGGTTTRLKPGQAWLLQENRVVEQFEARLLPPAPGPGIAPGTGPDSGS